MKHLKPFHLFESLKDEYQVRLAQIEQQKKDALNQIKLKIDEIMYEILDEYQTNPNDDYIDDKRFEIGYCNIQCKWKDVDLFINLLKSVFKILEEEFEVNCKVRANFLYRQSIIDFELQKKPIEHEFTISVDKLENWINRLKDSHALGLDVSIIIN